MTISVISPAFYPDLERCRYLRDSAIRHHIPIHWYGVGEQFINWEQTHITRCLQVLRDLPDGLVMFVDALDTIFVDDLDGILATYRQIGEPEVLVSYEASGINAGGWMGDRQACLELIGKLAEITDEGDPQERWRRYYKEFIIHPEIDSMRQVFTVMTDGSDFAKSPSGAVLHWAGAYADPQEGKIAAMKPFWERLGY